MEDEKPVNTVESVTNSLAVGQNDYKPVIGILTMPTPDENKKNEFKHEHYMFTYNNVWVTNSGARTLAIPYDIQEEDLNKILS